MNIDREENYHSRDSGLRDSELQEETEKREDTGAWEKDPEKAGHGPQEEAFFTGSRTDAKARPFTGDSSGTAGFFDYFRFIRPYFLVITLVFFASAFAGYASSTSSPEIGKMVMDQFNSQFGPILQLHPVLIMLVIFLNNAFVSLLFLVLGLALGILPVLFVAFNGYVVGVLSNFVAGERGFLFVFLALLPHGIVELPMVFLAAGIGLRLGYQVFSALLGRKTEIKREFKEGVGFYFRWILPLLFIAAVIETFITPLIMEVI